MRLVCAVVVDDREGVQHHGPEGLGRLQGVEEVAAAAWVARLADDSSANF
jgi:hypothetical protein